MRAYQGHTSETIILDVRKSQLQREGKTNKVQRRGSKELFAGPNSFHFDIKRKKSPNLLQAIGQPVWRTTTGTPKKTVFTHGGTRTHNLPLRRRTPYPLGHAGSVFILSLNHKDNAQSLSMQAGGFSFLHCPSPVTAIVAERLRRLTRNQIPSGSAGSNPADCEKCFLKCFLFLRYS